MLSNHELAKLILKSLSDEIHNEDLETEKVLCDELLKIADDSFLKLALLRLCEKLN